MPPRRTTHRSPARFIARVLPGVVTARYPDFVDPAAVTAAARPRGEQWIHEVNQPGLRAQLHLLDGAPSIYLRDGADATRELAALAKTARDIAANKLILDGVLTANSATAPPRFLAFDILYLDGFDIRQAPLIDRKRVLAMLLEGANAAIAPLAYATEPSRLTRAKRAVFVAKDSSEPYRSGVASRWIEWRVR